MKNVLIFAAIVASIALQTQDASAQLFRRARACAPCRSVVCSNASGYFRSYTGGCFDGTCFEQSTATAVSPCFGGSCLIDAEPAPALAPCEAVQKVEATAPAPCEPASAPAPCEAIQTIAEPAPAACEPVQAVEPCEPVEECLPCAPVRGTASRRVFSAPCPLRTAARAVAERLELARINVARIARGLRPLANDPTLEAGARATAVRNAREGRLRHYGGSFEIIAYNYGGGIDGAIRQWTASPAHARILFGANFTRAGVYTVRDGFGRCWFAARFN